MEQEDSTIFVRKLSSRRSKPDMAALVDQHRYFYPVINKRNDISIESLMPVVALQDLEDNLLLDSDSSSHIVPSKTVCKRSSPLQTKKIAKKVRKLHIVNGSRGPSVISNDQTDNNLNMEELIKTENDFHEENDGVGSEEELEDKEEEDDDDDNKDDEDDNLPLSSFIPNKVIYDTPRIDENSLADELSTVPLCECTKPAVLDDPRWDGQYCSAECLVRSCHQAFDIWLHNHNNQNENNNQSNSLDVAT